MKKFAVIGSTLAAVLVAGSMSLTAFADSNPADDASGYSFNTGSQAAQSRNNAFAEMPTGDDLSDEELDAFFQSHGIGSGAAYADGQYDESAKTGYGYSKGQAAYQQRHASFTGSN